MVLSAADVREETWRLAVRIHFDEPVVLQSVVQNSHRENLSPADRGLDLFDVSGDADHKPILQWVDQNELLVTFPKGTSVHTKYRLTFKPGFAKYLSEAPMKDPSVTFSCPKSELRMLEVDGMRDGFLVFPMHRETHEAETFSPSSSVTYRFEARRDSNDKVTRTVEARVVGQAQVRHHRNHYEIPELLKGKIKDWSTLTPETPLPGMVVVEPAVALDKLSGNEAWYLVADSGKDGDFRPSESSFMPDIELRTAVRQVLVAPQPEEPRPIPRKGGMSATADSPEQAPEMQLQIHFSSPVSKKDLPEIFRKLTIRHAGQVAVNDEGSLSKTLQVNGKPVTFKLLLPKDEVHVSGGMEQELNGEKVRVSYAPDDTVSALVMSFESIAPTVLEVVVPKDTSAALGLSTACVHCHRLNITPAQTTFDMQGEVLPLKGPRRIPVTLVNAVGMEVSAHYFTSEQAAQQFDRLSMLERASSDAASVNDLLYRLRLLELRHAAGLVKGKEYQSQRKSINSSLTRERNSLRNSANVAGSILSSVQSFPAQQFALGDAPAESLYFTHRTELELDKLTGGQTRPGLYVIAVKPAPAPAVRQQLESMQVKEEKSPLTHYIIVQVTDLMAHENDFLVAVSRMSDGSWVSEGSAILCGRNSIHAEVPVSQGVLSLECEKEDTFLVINHLVVKSGDDYCVVPAHRMAWQSPPPSPSFTSTQIFSDRTLYRPGDTVNLRAVIRECTRNGLCELPSDNLLNMTVYRPNGEVMIKRSLTVDAYGAVDSSFALPKDEEDVTGSYRVRLQSPSREVDESHYVRCEVFRRDAFTTELSVEADPIRPAKFTVKVKAKDYNGTPLAGGKVALDIHHSLSPSAPEKAVADPDQPHSDQSHSAEHELTLDAEGCAELTGELNTSYPMSHNGALGLGVSGSVVNDREEYVRLTPVHKTFYAADFRASLNGENLQLRKSVEEDILDRDQTVQLRFHYPKAEQTFLPNGIVYSVTKDFTVAESQLTVPAHCAEGMPLHLRRMMDNLRDGLSHGASLQVDVTGTDPKERLYQARLYYHAYWNEPSTSFPLEAKVADGRLKLSVQAPAAGQGLLLISSRAGIRTQLIALSGDREDLELPLKADEDGALRCTLVQFRPEDSGYFRTMRISSAGAQSPRKDMELNVTLQLPERSVAPGTEIILSGCAKTPDGKPAKAEVTLFAVDAGMLSVAGVPSINLAAHFGQASLNYARLNTMYQPLTGKGYANPSTSLFAGVWQGEIRGSGLSFEPGSHRSVYAAGGGTRFYRSRKMKSAAAFNSAMDDEACAFDIVPVEEECEKIAMEAAPAPPAMAAADSLAMGGVLGDGLGAESGAACTTGTSAAPEPRLRTDFNPVAVWAAALPTDAEGRFSTTVKLPDTLTTYRVYAVALEASGKRFSTAEGSFMVNQPVMITPGTPLFMSLGDCLRLPLTITNNSGQDGTWTVTLEGAAQPQSIALKNGSTGTLFFDFTAVTEGENKLRWTATATAGSDAVEGTFSVRFPAPVLKESHRLVLIPGADPVKVAGLIAPELADSTRGKLTIELSANPLLHLSGCMDYVLGYPYGCTEQTASGLLPWLFHSRLAPFSPKMAEHDAQDVQKLISKSIDDIFKRQLPDGGLGYWPGSKHSTLWASAYAALVFTIAEENGHALPVEKMKKLRAYLASRPENEVKDLSPLIRYALARACGQNDKVTAVINEILGKEADRPRHYGFFWSKSGREDLKFIAALRNKPGEGRHQAFLTWMRSRGHDYRHNTTWQSGWTFIALSEYLRLEPAESAPASVRLQDGQVLTLGNGATRITPAPAATLADCATVLQGVEGTAYVTVKVRALPNKTEYPGVTEHGLQVTRVYEKKGADGVWRPTTEFNVGDVIRVTLTCAKVADELEYFVLEDYLPSCMEAINPNVPSQAAGLEWRPWSYWFDHREFLADRVRGFCTRWGGRDLLNMSYYARVKRAGISTAPPAEAQLMYEPQTYGLSPNVKIISK